MQRAPEAGRANSIRFALPSMPVSVNSLYQIIYSQRRVELKPECRAWKTKAKEYMPPWKLGADSLIQIDVTFTGPHRYKNGKLRILDASNLLKLLIDAIAERYQFNDARVRFGSWASFDSDKESVTVTVTEVFENNDGLLHLTKGEH